jgi:hypothetical protein
MLQTFRFVLVVFHIYNFLFVNGFESMGSIHLCWPYNGLQHSFQGLSNMLWIKLHVVWHALLSDDINLIVVLGRSSTTSALSDFLNLFQADKDNNMTINYEEFNAATVPVSCTLFKVMARATATWSSTCSSALWVHIADLTFFCVIAL